MQSSAAQPSPTSSVLRDLLPPSTAFPNAKAEKLNAQLVWAADSWKKGKWRELVRIDWLHGTIADDETNVWWKHIRHGARVGAARHIWREECEFKGKRRGGASGRELWG